MDGWKETQQSNSVLQKVTCRCLNYIRNVGNADILVQTKAKSVAKVIEDLPLGNMNVCTHFHPNQIESYGHISVWEWCTNLQTSTSTAAMQTNWTWMSVDMIDLMSQNSIRLAQARHAAGKHADCDEWAICSTPAGWERCRCVFCHREAAVAHIPLAYGRRLHVEVGSSGDVTV